MISVAEKEQFHEQGYLIKRQMVDSGLLREIIKVARQHLQLRIPPFELETTVKYPGAPASEDAVGGNTIRRLLLAYSRDECIREWGKNRVVHSILSELFGDSEIYLCQSHHNCIMSKQPDYSSRTDWHKDIRYWNFDNDFLINSWLALGEEKSYNGCLRVIPGSHQWLPEGIQLDNDLFLKEECLENNEWLEKAVDIELQAGDVLFFHAGLFHSAGNNASDTPKFSLVFTYHGSSNRAIEGSKSTRYEEIKI